ncbi:MAG: hypothetical protein QM756_46680 [Polyangiaceae bacterium]
MYGLNAEQRELLSAYWWRRAEGEMTSWVGFRHVLADLRVERAPEPILALAERAVDDEHRHALWCREFALKFGYSAGAELKPRSLQPFEVKGMSGEQNRWLRILLCCFTETVGCFILRHVRPRMVEPEFLRNNQRHLADELQHSRVGWGYLATLNGEQHAFLRRHAPSVLELLPSACCDGPELERSESGAVRLLHTQPAARRLRRGAGRGDFARARAPGAQGGSMSGSSGTLRARHPLFNAMVLMGGSLALHCGGNATQSAAASGGATTSGGSGGTPSSGGTSFGGAPVITVSSGGANEVVPGPFDCPPAQWDCSATPPQCWDTGFILPEKCDCAPTRPLAAADCIDSDFVCRRAAFVSTGQRLSSPVDFECGCVSRQAYCSQSCEELYGYAGRCSEPAPGVNAFVCQCAVIVLR